MRQSILMSGVKIDELCFRESYDAQIRYFLTPIPYSIIRLT